MLSQEKHIEFTKTGRYFTYGNPETAHTLLIALHGYGQLAAYFIRKFHGLNPTDFFVVCPEGPHRFYQSGTSGRVGASWMTKEDRLNDIQDQIQFLDQLMTAPDISSSFSKKVLLGFSQGGATASRWLAYGKHSQFDQFILWAAVFPPDMTYEAHQRFTETNNYFVVGKQDEFITEEKAYTLHQQLNSRPMQFEMLKFDGNHNIDLLTLKKLIE